MVLTAPTPKQHSEVEMYVRCMNAAFKNNSSDFNSKKTYKTLPLFENIYGSVYVQHNTWNNTVVNGRKVWDREGCGMVVLREGERERRGSVRRKKRVGGDGFPY